MRTLTIETSTPVEEVAVVEDGRVLSARRSQAGCGRADELAGSVADVLASAGTDVAELDAVAVSIGPGRFTGLRVGLATAKGLAEPTGLRVVPVPTLEALAMSSRVAEGLVCPVLDARRGEVYAALFRLGGDTTRLMPDLALAPDDLARRLSSAVRGRPILFVGTGAEPCALAVRAVLGAAFLAPEIPMPEPRALAALAGAAILEGRPVVDAEPVYLRGV